MAVLPNNTIVKATDAGFINLPNELTNLAKQTYVMPTLTNESLISVDKLCDDNCKVNFTKTKVDGIKNNKIIKDQFVKIADIQINQLSLTKNNFRNYSKFVNAESGDTTHQIDGVYQNGEFILSLKTPIFPYLSKLFQDNVQNYNVEKKYRDSFI